MYAVQRITGIGLLLLQGVVAPNLSIAQEHPFIADYFLTELDGGVRVDWTIQGGNTCDGQEIERSTNGVDFQAVHRIEGICGDPAFAVPFHWFDITVPEFSSLHYRIKLGAQGYSSVKSIVFDQLTSSSQRFFPSPVEEQATLLINVPASATVELRILDMTGKEIMNDLAATGPKHVISMINAPAGLYFYVATSGGRTFQGRFMKR
jgi:hypothetical protein